MRWASYEPRKHLLDAEADPPKEECPICGETGPRDKRLAIQSDPDVFLLRCRKCLGISASRMPKREVLDELYRSYYEQNKHERVIFQNPSRLARHILSSIDLGAGPSAEIRIIDFGGGDGSIARLAGELIVERTRRPTHVQVVDYVDETSSRHGQLDLEFVRDVKEASDNCDLIIASGVFEHIPELGSLLAQLVLKLRLGGYLYARTLYGLPFMKMFAVDMSYPAHVHDLGDDFWGALPSWFPIPIELVRSRPAIVEADFRQQPLRTLLAHCFKLPARIESLWTEHPVFKLYGGWEVVLQRSRVSEQTF